MVQCIEELSTELELHALGNTEVSCDSEVQSLHSRPIYRVASHIAKGKCRRCGEPSSVKPLRRGLRSRPENWLSGVVCANRVLSEYRAGVCVIAEHRNGEREAGLHLIDS